MKRIVKISESNLRKMICEAISIEMQDKAVEDIYEFFESQDVNWDKWKDIALQLMNWIGDSELVKWAEANDYYNPYYNNEPEEEEYGGNGPYTMSNWRHDKNLDNLQPGTDVSDEVIDELAGAVPPTTYRNGCFQPGEPYTHYKGQPLYMTFTASQGGSWKYVGLCFAGQVKPVTNNNNI